MAKGISALAGSILRFLKIILLNIAEVFIVIGKKIFLILKEFFKKLSDIIRYNPVVRKVSVVSLITVFLLCSVSLVFFAVLSPELPPGNLFSSINEIYEYHETHNYSRTDVVSSSSDDDWVALTAFSNSDFETGAGSLTQDRSMDFEYPVRPGETLSEIAYAYDIPYDFLAWYNKIAHVDRIKFGTVLIIPSLENIQSSEREYQSQRAIQRQAEIVAKTARSINVTYSSRNSGNGSGVSNS